MTIEYLFPEACGIFGDQANFEYLRKCLPDAKAIYTSLEDEPYFLFNHVDLVYIGQMTERNQIKVINKLMPFKEKIKELIENETIFLATGNASEIFGSAIIEEDGSKINCLNLFDTIAKQDIWHRYNGFVIGDFEDMELIGFKSQFSHSYGEINYPFIHVNQGIGINPESKEEGFHYKKLFATYLIGPFLIMNTPFVEFLLKELGSKNEIACKKEMYKAYEERLKDFKRLLKR